MEGKKKILEIEVDDAGMLYTLTRVSANNGTICYVRKPMTRKEAEVLAPAVQFLARRKATGYRAPFSQTYRNRERACVLLRVCGTAVAVTGLLTLLAKAM